MRPFVPRRFLSNGHLQTIVGNFLPRTYSLPEPESQLIEVEGATSARGASFVLCHCHWQPAIVARPISTFARDNPRISRRGCSKIRYLIVAKGCSTVDRRSLIASE